MRLTGTISCIISSNAGFFPREESLANSKLLLVGSSQCTTGEEAHCAGYVLPKRITVILPAFNEEVSIGSIVLLTRKYADRVIVVDDGSSDRTSEIAEKAGAEVIVHQMNEGKGAALRTGFEFAKNSDIIVTMDSDGQHNPAEIPKLIAPIIEGMADMVNGSRYLNGMDKNTPAYRRVGQTILDNFTNMNSGLKVTDSQSGFRAFAASTIAAFRFNSQGMAIESEMLADAGKAGLRIKEIEIDVRYDVDSSTMNPIKHGFEVFITVLKDMESNRSLFNYRVFGTLLGIGCLYIGVYFLQTFSEGESMYFGSTILLMLFLLGVLRL